MTLVKWKLVPVYLEIVLITMQPMVLLRDVGQVKLVSIRLEILLISAQDRCPVCFECTMGKEIDLGTPDGTPR